MNTQTNSEALPLTNCSPRYSFRLPNGNLPIADGKLAWVGDKDVALKDAKSWGAVAVVVLRPKAESDRWIITEEISLENAERTRGANKA